MTIRLEKLAAALLATCAFGVQAQEKLLVQVPALLDAGAPITESVRRDCDVEGKVGEHVFEKVGAKVPTAERLADPRKAGGARLLKVTIINVLGVGGGAWSGSKAITIRVDLEQNSKVHASKVLTRQSGGGAFGGMKGTCSIMERIAVALGSDVASWVPTGLAMLPAPGAAPASDAAPAAAAPVAAPAALPAAGETK
jgi:hypothetical protein